ncbi:MAG: hypothetical protein J1E59_09835, partial [Treponema sp.]|nr:hypothetical protein [Treponema sp.]
SPTESGDFPDPGLKSASPMIVRLFLAVYRTFTVHVLSGTRHEKGRDVAQKNLRKNDILL